MLHLLWSSIVIYVTWGKRSGQRKLHSRKKQPDLSPTMNTTSGIKSLNEIWFITDLLARKKIGKGSVSYISINKHCSPNVTADPETVRILLNLRTRRRKSYLTQRNECKYLPPATEVAEGNVFRGVCQSFCCPRVSLVPCHFWGVGISGTRSLQGMSTQGLSTWGKYSGSGYSAPDI